MKPNVIKINQHFVGRTLEWERLCAIGITNEPSIIIMYGRRRVGKTELLEQVFRERNILKFEGIENLTEAAQFESVMSRLAIYAEDPLLAKVVIHSWREFFEILAKYLEKGKWTLYLEELQWLANYESTLIAELKFVWDNYFRHNPELIIILCGSAPSFMIDQVVHSKALYNRSEYEFHLREFTLIEARKFLNDRSEKEVLNAYLTVGGIPEYLKWVNKDSSVFLSLCKHSFISGGFFAREYEKVFTSNMAKNKHYEQIVDVLSKKRFATRQEITKALKINSGGNLTKQLLDLEKSGFICKYSPFNLNEDSILTRYAISDNYLYYYFKFIKPIRRNIENGEYDANPKAAIRTDNYTKWLGFAFERFCRKYHFVIAKILGFSGVQYQSGVFFNRKTDQKDAGYQIDLVFDRQDNVYTICEIKYLQSKVGVRVISEFEKKLSLFPNKGNKTLHKVLICIEGIDDELKNRAYFDDIITCSQIFNPGNWQQ